MPRETDAERLAKAGSALYGPRWVAPLAQEVGIPLPRMRALAAGREALTPPLAFLVSIAVRKRQTALRMAAHLARWRRLDLAWHEILRADGIDPPASILHHGANPLGGRPRRGFAGAVADAGLPAEITPHWLRHTCATWLMEAGVPIWDAAGFTGMTIKTLEKCYGHHRPEHQECARAAFVSP